MRNTFVRSGYQDSRKDTALTTHTRPTSEDIGKTIKHTISGERGTLLQVFKAAGSSPLDMVWEDNNGRIFLGFLDYWSLVPESFEVGRVYGFKSGEARYHVLGIIEGVAFGYVRYPDGRLGTWTADQKVRHFYREVDEE